ncbi:MAG: biopolymer transporter ExbD [Pseudomonadota bacterium]
MNAAQVRAKARMAMKRREDEIEEDEMESGELNLVPYLDIVTNVMLFLLATISTGIILGNINSALPEYAAGGAGAADDSEPPEPPIQLVVAVTKPEVVVFSLSGQEGTLKEPKAKIPATKPALEYPFDKLSEVATEIVKRRWPDKGNRPEKSTEVILMADPEIPYSAIVGAMDALRQAKDGGLLFPDIIFSTGIQ